MSEFDKEVMWAVSGTGDDFQCVHVDFAREQQAEIERLRDALVSVRAEIDLRKAPKLMAKIESALGIDVAGQTVGKP